MSDETMYYTCWSEDHPEQGEALLHAARAGWAAKEWLEERWSALGQPSEARVHVRRHSDKQVFVFDVRVEGIQLDLTAMSVELDADGKPLSIDELERRANAARATLEAKRALDRAARATG